MAGQGPWRVWPLVGLATFVLAIGAMLVIVFTRASGNPNLVALAVSIASAVVAPWLTAIGVTLWRRSRWQDSTSPTGDADAADVLADAVRKLWRTEAAERRLSAPAPIPIRWEWTRLPVTGSIDEAVDPTPGPGRLGALPGVRPAVAATVKEGGLSDLFAVYGGLSSGRIILLGGPGTGKSAAAILTLLDALDHRRRVADVDVRATVPVPVLLTPRDWDPSRQTLVDWLAVRIVADFPVLRIHGYGTETTARLVRDGRIALFLDGFDELAPGFRTEMLHALNALPDLRLVMLSCGPELLDAARVAHVYGAAALELRPILPDTAAEYLIRIQVRPTPAPWCRLAEHVRAQPAGALAQALDSPLMLTLLRDTFVDPGELDQLLTQGRFDTRAQVEDDLLARVLPNAYQPLTGRSTSPYDLPHAARWLRRIAAEMTDRDIRDLAWWQLPEWAPAPVRVLLNGLVGIGVGGLTGEAVARFTDELGERNTPGYVPFAIVGLTVGLAAGLVAERRDSRGAGVAARTGSAGFRIGFGLVSGFVTAIAGATTIGPKFGLAPALIVGLGAGLSAGVGTGIAADARVQSTRMGRRRSGIGAMLWAALLSGLPAGLAAGLPAGLVTGVPVGLAYGPLAGISNGLVVGLGFVAAFAIIDGLTMTPIGPTTAASPISVWRQDRLYSALVGIIFGIALGFAAGFTDGITSASHDPLNVAVPVGAITGLVVGVTSTIGAMIIVSRTWSVTLLFGQLWLRGAAPVRGMRFLQDAHRLGVLRVAGPVYQFRHARLQDRLALESDRGGPVTSAGSRRGSQNEEIGRMASSKAPTATRTTRSRGRPISAD